jgi:hypothetical protein
MIEALLDCSARGGAPLCSGLSLLRGKPILGTVCHGGELIESRYRMRALRGYKQLVFVIYGHVDLVTDLNTLCGL